MARPRLRARARLTIAVAGLALAGCGVGVHAGVRAPKPSRARAVPASLSRSVTRSASYAIVGFMPQGARTAWALTSGNELRDPPQAVVRTGDAGARWSNVTPPGLARAGQRTRIGDLDVLGPRRAWLTYGSDEARQELLRTLDGGRSWSRVGVTPGNDRMPQFVDARDGWCVVARGAAGSMFLTIDRTRDGGRRWRRVERTGLDARGGPTQIPFGCDKSVTFVSRTTGFVVSAACAGGEDFVYRSTDGGRRWRQTLSLPGPKGASNGSQFTQVAGDGLQDAVGVVVVGYRRTPTSTTIFTSHDDGLRWSRARLPARGRVYHLALVSPRVWRLAAGRELESTDDGGRVCGRTPT